MKSKKLLLAFRLAIIVAAFASLTTLPLLAQVQGTWFGTGTNGCLVAAPGAGFNPNLTPTDGVSFQSSSSQITLDISPAGIGTGTFVEFPLTVPPASGVGGSSSKGSFSFTYTIAADGTLTVTFISLNGQVLSGPSAGASFTLVPPPLTGTISGDGKTMLLSSEAPTDNAHALSAVETLHIVGGPSFQRLCNRTRVFALITLKY